MTAEQRIVINGLPAKHNAHAAIDALDIGQPAEMILKPWQPKRSLSANALYWVWMRELAKHMTRKIGKEFDDDLMHDVCRQMFLYYRSPERRRIDGSIIPPQLESTTKLKKSEFCHYMTRIDSWAITQLGLRLPRDKDDEYQKYLDAQGGVE